MNRHIDTGSLSVAAITLGLFVAALFTKGITHDLFLETGVFLLSVKLILAVYRNGVLIGRLDKKLDAILAILSKPGDKEGNAGDKEQRKSDTT